MPAVVSVTALQTAPTGAAAGVTVQAPVEAASPNASKITPAVFSGYEAVLSRFTIFVTRALAAKSKPAKKFFEEKYAQAICN